jgi:hypothetical protein
MRLVICSGISNVKCGVQMMVEDHRGLRPKNYKFFRRLSIYGESEIMNIIIGLEYVGHVIIHSI